MNMCLRSMRNLSDDDDDTAGIELLSSRISLKSQDEQTMERKRSQQQRLKQQQRFCVSQQDLSDALAKMKPVRSNSTQDQHAIVNSTSTSVSMERLTNPPVSQLIKEFEARATLTPYASAQDLLPTNRDESLNEAISNSSHMSSVRSVKIKGKSNDNDIINKNVCLSISSPPPPLLHRPDDNQMVKVDFSDRSQLLIDERNKATRRTSTPETNCHKDELHSATMTARSTDIDEAMEQRHQIHFDELLSKEAQLNHALADLISMTNDNRSSSFNSSPRSPIHQHQRVSTPKNFHLNNQKSSISASIDLLNNLIETFDLDKTEADENEPIDPSTNPIKPVNIFRLMLSDNVCGNCQQLFAANEQIVNAAGQIWHQHCFVCSQCFQPFENGLYFEHEGRKYCQRDFQMLFAPFCSECQQAIIGRVIRALQKCFHPQCFRCQLCQNSLVDCGFLKLNGKALCRDCHGKEKKKDPSNSTKQICSTCHEMMNDKFLKYKGEYYHPHHFRCTSCQVELNEQGREMQGYLYCHACHNKLDLPICAACHRLIDDRVIHALGKQWHVDHFCCARCARPFYGTQHYEHQGLAYCEFDYQTLFGSKCFVCQRIITDGTYTACNKTYCSEHFQCSSCEKKFNEKSKFYDVDATPVCKQCFGKLSSNVRKSIQQQNKHKRKSSKLRQTSV